MNSKYFKKIILEMKKQNFLHFDFDLDENDDIITSLRKLEYCITTWNNQLLFLFNDPLITADNKSDENEENIISQDLATVKIFAKRVFYKAGHIILFKNTSNKEVLYCCVISSVKSGNNILLELAGFNPFNSKIEFFSSSQKALMKKINSHYLNEGYFLFHDYLNGQLKEKYSVAEFLGRTICISFKNKRTLDIGITEKIEFNKGKTFFVKIEEGNDRIIDFENQEYEKKEQSFFETTYYTISFQNRITIYFTEKHIYDNFCLKLFDKRIDFKKDSIYSKLYDFYNNEGFLEDLTDSDFRAFDAFGYSVQIGTSGSLGFLSSTGNIGITFLILTRGDYSWIPYKYGYLSGSFNRSISNIKNLPELLKPTIPFASADVSISPFVAWKSWDTMSNNDSVLTSSWEGWTSNRAISLKLKAGLGFSFGGTYFESRESYNDALNQVSDDNSWVGASIDIGAGIGTPALNIQGKVIAYSKLLSEVNPDLIQKSLMWYDFFSIKNSEALYTILIKLFK